MARLRIAFKTEKPKDPSNGGEAFFCRDNLFVVAEGVEGDSLGEMIREKVCKGIPDSFFKCLSKERSPAAAIVTALSEVNAQLFQERKRTGTKIAASVSIAYVPTEIMYFSHLGDSRIYCLHKGEIIQLTRDHTVGEEGSLGEPGGRDPRLLRALTDGLGVRERPDIKVKTFALRENDIILMTTEGLTRYLSNMQILKLSLKHNRLKKVAGRLIEEANRKGAKGPMTLGLIRFEKFPFLMDKRVIAGSAAGLVLLAILASYSLRGNQKMLPPSRETVHKAEPKAAKPAVKPSRPAAKPTVKAAEPKAVESGVPAGPTAAAGPMQKKETAKKSERGLEQEIRTFLAEWKEAWERTAGPGGKIERYLSFYGEEFRSQGLDKKAWGEEKRATNQKKEWIRIDLSELRVGVVSPDNRLEVRFRQDYKSSNYSVKSGKTLLLKKVGSGWKIVSEKGA